MLVPFPINEVSSEKPRGRSDTATMAINTINVIVISFGQMLRVVSGFFRFFVCMIYSRSMIILVASVANLSAQYFKSGRMPGDSVSAF